MNDFQDFYTHAREAYQPECYELIFDAAEIASDVQRVIGKDIFAAAGAIYLGEMDAQETRLSQAHLIAEIAKARKASAELARALQTINRGSNQGLALNEAAIDLREQLIEEHGKDSDTYAIASSIFSLNLEGAGFRQTGLENALKFLNDSLENLKTEEIQRTRKNRIDPLTNWASVLMFYWLLAKGRLPTVGHYDSEVAERGSNAVRAFTLAAQVLDPEITERLVVKAMSAAKASIQTEPMKPWLFYTIALTLIIDSGVAHSPKKYVWYFLTLPNGQAPMPESQFDLFWGQASRKKVTKEEQAFVSKEQFLETLYSAEGGIKLSEALVAMTPK
ncbi:MAG: hypothetical protein ABJM82_18055 [Shimia thalassica]|uniref:hypothetical protein n=1 Tax=Rhodobacterales TaxID=204455 RepID=UPI00329884EA